MIGDNVRNQSHVVLAQRGAERAELVKRADFWIDRRVIDDVVAVRAVRAGLKERRSVEVADA